MEAGSPASCSGDDLRSPNVFLALCWPRAWKPSTWKSSDSRHQRKIPGQRHPLSSSHPNAIGEVEVACAAVWGVFGIPAPVPMGQMQHLEEPDWVS